MFLHGFDMSCAFRLDEGLPVVCEGPSVMHIGLSVTCHDCNHDSHAIAMT